MKINHNELLADLESKSTKLAFIAATCKSKVCDLSQFHNSKLEIIYDRLFEIEHLIDDILTVMNEK